MNLTTEQVVWFAALVGHFGLHLTIYNRLNSLGFSRATIKLIEKIVFLEMWVTLGVISWRYQDVIVDLMKGNSVWSVLSIPIMLYGSICLLAWIVFGLPWLLWRPIFRWEWADAPRRCETVDVAKATGVPLALTAKCKLESSLPFNQIFDLAVEEIQLPVPGLPADLVGYQIAHLSDIHLTGHVAPAYAEYAVERANDWKPDLLALSGDIIDKQPCIDWLPQIFSKASAPDGCHYVLGNHDTRIVDSWQTRDAMDRAGWTDLGSRVLTMNLRETPAQVIGNEYPWFERPEVPEDPNVRFKLLVSHSPDQITWARRRGIHLMLAGHTHGGQGRLPLAGPLLSPSIHGSRYASGDFYRAPTTMHVSRGIGGVHLLRINCRPELSLITLKAAEV